MRRALFAVSSTVVGLVLLLSFKTHPATVTTPPAALSTPDTGDGPAATAAPSTTPSSSAAAGDGSAKTVTGDAVDTRWGPVQVQITVTGGTVTAGHAVEDPPNNPRDVQINAFAIPQLDQEATAAKSAQIDMVSGATVTSEGYLQSLQSALDQAGL